MRWISLVALVVMLLAAADAPVLPETAAGRRAAAFIEAFNSGDRDRLRAWETEHRSPTADERRSLDDRVAIEMQLHAVLGTIAPRSMVEAGTDVLTVAVWCEGMESHANIRFGLEPEPPHRVLSIRIESTGPPELAARRYDDWDDLAALLEQLRADGELPAAAAAIVAEDRIVEQAVVGVRELGAADPCRIDDAFHVGSITKSMTATVVATLVERGQLDWQTTLREMLPDVAVDRAYAEVTIEQLMRHRGGIQPHLTFDGTEMGRLVGLPGPPSEQRRAFVSEVLLERPVGEPGSTMQYSNAGYGLLGHLAETRANAAWEQLMQEMVFEPAAMTTAGIGWPATAARPDQPHGHYAGGDGLTAQGLDEYHLGSFLAPAGDVHCSIGDLARYARMHLRGLQGRDGALRASTVARLHTPPPGSTGAERYAGGWVIQTDPRTGRTRHWHNGSAGTFYAAVALYPAEDLAIVFATNTGGGAAETLSEKLFEAVLARRETSDPPPDGDPPAPPRSTPVEGP